MKQHYLLLKSVQTAAQYFQKGLFAILVLTCMIASGRVQAQTVHYVNASAVGANNGTSWNNAYRDLQPALDAAAQGDQIWVARGTYKPSKDITGNANPSNARTKTFLLKNGVMLYGGFSGSEAAINDRDIAANATVLSGDLDNNDGENFDNHTYNSYHVVVANGLTVPTALDGFIISGGHAGLQGDFAGIYNGGKSGGGLFVTNSGSSLTVRNCIITSNRALHEGGGMYNYSSATVISNCVFKNNKAAVYGTSGGGGALATYGSAVTIANSVFDSNVSEMQGGGLLYNGGGTIVNSVFVNNSATAGGAIRILSTPSVIVNCTVAGNYSGSEGGIYSTSFTATTIRNSIIREFLSGPFAVRYSNIQGETAGNGNIDSDPHFSGLSDPDGPDNRWGTADDGLILRETSPSANSGSNADVPADVITDITGEARIQNGTVNMGAYEALKAAGTLFVNAAASPGGNGLSWATAFNNLQSALEAAFPGDEIWVAKGTYKPSKDVNGDIPGNARRKTFMLKGGVKIYGGFNGSEAVLGARDIKANATILSGDHNGNDGSNFANYTDNSYNVVSGINLAALTILDGFTIRGGNANDFSSNNGKGGGILVTGSSDKFNLVNCIVSENYASHGGGIYSSGSAVNINGCVFTRNTAVAYGGGLYLMGTSSLASSLVVNSVFVGNSVGNTPGYRGGAIFLDNAKDAKIVNCTITGNAGSDGQGIYSNQSLNVAIANSVIWGGQTSAVNYSLSAPSVIYSNIQSGFPGTANISADPLFVNISDPDGADNIWGTADDGLHLLSSSPSNNTGSDAAVPANIITDIAGAIRKQGTVNMGAYEAVKLIQTISDFPATDTKTYGDAVYTLSATGGASGNPVVYSSSDNNVAVVSGNQVTIKGAGTVTITATQAGDLNHVAATATQTLTVNRRPITITADAKSKVYGDADPELTYKITSGSVVGEDTFSGSLSRVSGSSVGSYPILRNTLTLGTNYDLTFASDNLTINKAPLTVTADNATRPYGEANPTFTFAITGFKNGETAAELGLPGSIRGTTTATATSAAGTTHTITPGAFPFLMNYTFEGETGELVITKAELFVKPTNISRSYGDENPKFTFGFTGLKNNETASSLGLPGDITAITEATKTSPSGTYSVTAGNLPALANYTLVSNTGTLTVTKAALTVTANNVTRVYGEANPVFTFSISGFKNEEAASDLGLPGTITASTTATATSTAGATYPITPGNFPSLQNYSFSGINGTLTIDKAVLTVTADNATRAYGDANPAFTFSISGFKNGENASGLGLPGSITANTTATATSPAGTTHPIMPGNFPTLPNYSLTASNGTLTIDKAVLTVKPQDVSREYGAANPTFTFEFTGFRNGETASALGLPGAITASTTATAASPAGTYSVTAANLPSLANYTIASDAGSLTISKATLTVKANSTTRVYGDDNPTLSVSYSGFRNGETAASLGLSETVTATTTADRQSPSGQTYLIEVTGVPTLQNYNINAQTGQLSVTRAELSLKPADVTRQYGVSNPEFTVEVSGLKNNETLSELGLDNLTATTTATAHSFAGTYVISLGATPTLANYDITRSNGVLTIDKADITLKAKDQIKIFNRELIFDGSEFAITSGALAAGEQITRVTLSSSGAAANAVPGTYDILISDATGIQSVNYNITYEKGRLEVVDRPVLTVKAGDIRSVYGSASPLPAFTYTITGFIDGDNETSISGTPQITSAGSATSDAGTYTINIANGSLASSKYVFNFEPATLTIDPAALTVAAANLSKIYGDTDPAFTYSVTAGTLLPGNTLSGSLKRAAGENTGTYNIIEDVPVSAGGNYTVTFVPGVLTIDKRAVSISAVAKSKVYGDTDPEFTVQITSGSLVVGDTYSGELQRVAGESVGKYVINIGSLTLGTNYQLSFTAGELTISPKPLTIAAGEQAKIYGDADPELSYTITSGALVGTDKFIGSLEREAGENAGVYEIKLGTLSAGSNYTITFSGSDLTIGRRVLEIVMNDQTKIYGDADPGFDYTIAAGNLIGNDQLSGTPTRMPGEAVGEYEISGEAVSGGTNYQVQYTVGKLKIAPRPVIVAAVAASKSYGDADPVLTYRLADGSSLIAGDSFSGALSRDAGENVGDYAINKGTLTLGANYDISFVSAALNIGKRALTVTADGKNKTYGDADPQLTHSITSGSLVDGDVLSGSLIRETGENAGGYAIVEQTGFTVNGNYAVTFIPGTLTISQKVLNVSAVAQSKTYGDVDPELSYTVNGTLLNGDVMTGMLARTAGENVGQYGIDLNTLTAGANYRIEFEPAALIINARPLTIATQSVTKIYGDSDPQFTYTITSGTLVGNDQLSGAPTRIAGEDVGEYEISGESVSAGSNYLLHYTSGKLHIAPRPITVNAQASSKSYGDGDPVFEYSLADGSSLIAGDSFSGALSRTPGESIGDYTISQGSLTLSSNYDMTFVSAMLTIGKRTLSVTADPKSKTYGDEDPQLTYSITAGSLLQGDVLSGSLMREPGENAGSYAIVEQAVFAVNGNYSVSFAPGTLTVDPKVLNVSAVSQTKTYGDADPDLIYTVTGTLVNGDVLTGSLSRTAGENVGQYGIDLNTLTAGPNYRIAFEPASLIIIARSLTVITEAVAKIYGDADPEFIYTITEGALRDGDNITGALGRVAGENTGEYMITLGTLTAGPNYMIMLNPSSLTIYKANLTITADDMSRPQGRLNPQFTATYSGFRNGDTPADLKVMPKFSTSATPVSLPGTYPILVDGAASDNYTITYVSGILTVTVAGQTTLSRGVVQERKPSGTWVGDFRSSGTVSSSLNYTLVGGAGSEDNAFFTIDGTSLKTAVVFNHKTRNNFTIRVRTSDATGVYFDTNFVVTVEEVALAGGATNIITPNGDGVNDTWAVKDIEKYPENRVQIFDRSGRLIYRKNGYANEWNGMADGSLLPEDTYYYVVELAPGMTPLKGFITLVRTSK